MKDAKKIAVIIGSLRKDSWNRKIAKVLQKISPASLDLQIVEIANLPMYNQDPDDEGKPHEEWTDFRNTMQKMDGVLFLTPEYNRSIPAPLKNAIDVGSRPYGKSIWTKKPGAVISISPGAIGGFGANQHLRQCFVFLDIPCLQQPEAYIGNIAKLFENDQLNPDTQKFLAKFLDDYEKWVQLNHAVI